MIDSLGMRILPYLAVPAVGLKFSVFDRLRDLIPGQKPKIISRKDVKDVPDAPVVIPKPLNPVVLKRATNHGDIDWIEMPPDPSVPEEFRIKYDLDQSNRQINRLVREQKARDQLNQKSRPYLRYDSEILGDGTRVVLDREPIALNPDVTVYPLQTVLEDGIKLVVKYQTNCRIINSKIMDLERDYWFLKLVEDLDVAPRALFLSPPVKLPRNRTPKTRFDMSKDKYEMCANNPKSYVRYMVMERIELTIYDIMYKETAYSWRDRFLLAITVAIEVIGKLEQVHKRGIVHGDIHPKNVGLLSSGHFGLIDFGRAFFESEYDLRKDVTLSFRVHCYLSDHNLAGSRFGFRDDVYKTLFTAASLAVPEVFEACLMLAQSELNREALKQLHGEVFLFNPADIDAFGRADIKNAAQVRAHLEAALAASRHVARVEDKPDYASIISSLNEALELL